MSDYSIELSAERIVDARTKRYFSEVHGCYAAGYYRSAVVMLWSVVVTDVLFKLEQLASAYGDSTANALLKEVADSRKNNPKSPEWESDLINKVASRTDLIDSAELSHLHSLQAHRHLSAHPVINRNEALFSPNQETARAHIRNVLDGVLTKPPIMSRKVFDAFIEDVEQMGKLSPGPDGLETFLKAKYFRHFSPATFAHIFRSLWRVVFRSTDPRCEANRIINAQALDVLFRNRQAEFTKLIEDERDWFSDVSLQEGQMTSIIQFLQRHPQVFPLLGDALKGPIRSYANLSLDHFALCWFINHPEGHVDEIRQRIQQGGTIRGDILKSLHDSLGPGAAQTKAVLAGMELYGRSTNFDAADSRFAEMVEPYLSNYTREQMEAFLACCENSYNGQATGRWRAGRDHAKVKATIDSKFSDIDLDEFPEFRRSLQS